jgi:1,2-diacylglycerol 3-alpha-glucosyltransferase
LNIGIVTSWYSCGAGYVSKSYESVLSKEHNVFIYARQGNKNSDPSWEQENVCWAPEHPCSTGIYRTHFKKWIKSRSIELVLFNEQRYWKPVIQAKKLHVITGAYVDYYTADTVPLFGIYDFLICNTQRHFSVFKEHSHCCYLPWGTQTDLYKPLDEKPKRKITFIVSAGREGETSKQASYMDRRGSGIILRVFRKLTEDCKLIIYSQSPLNKCSNEWKKVVELDERIEFRYGTYHPFPYTEGDIFLYPSRLDGIGLTLPEALSCGLPAITTNSPPMNEFVQHDINGILVDVKEFRGRPDGYYWAESICDEDDLLNAMQLYLGNPDLIITHGKNARNLAERNLSFQKNSEFLSNWISQRYLSKNNCYDNNQFLFKRAMFYDRHRSPTPTQRILIGFKRLLTQVLVMLGHFIENLLK